MVESTHKSSGGRNSRMRVRTSAGSDKKAERVELAIGTGVYRDRMRCRGVRKVLENEERKRCINF